MKKIIATILTLALLCVSFGASAEPETAYNCSDWAVESVETALNVGFLDSEKTYDYKSVISRQEFCEMIANLLVLSPFFSDWCEEVGAYDTEDPSVILGDSAFSDTENIFVRLLHHLGIIYGKTETTFAPDDALTREEAAVIFVRMLNTIGPMPATEMYFAYDDLDQVSTWAEDAVQVISNLGFMQGVGDNRFAPKDTLTIEQATAITIRIFEVNIVDWLFETMKEMAGELGYVYENDTWNFVTFDMGAGRRVTPIDVDADEFRVLDYEGFARDNDNLFYRGKNVDGADPDTFEVISTASKLHYAKDKNFVYLYEPDDSGVLKIHGADPATFQALDFPYAKDQHDAYNGNLPLFVDDVTTFEVVETGESLHTSFYEAFFGGFIYPEEMIKYNNEKFSSFIDVAIYSLEGKAKTQNLVYEGYMPVGD